MIAATDFANEQKLSRNEGATAAATKEKGLLTVLSPFLGA